MEEYESIIDYLYNKKDDDGLIDLESAVLNKQNKEVARLEKVLSKFIDKKVHPKCRKQLKELIKEYTLAMFGCWCTEKELVYKDGFSDSIKMLLVAFNKKI